MFFKLSLRAATIFCSAITGIIAGFIFYESLKGLEDPGLKSLFFDEAWNPEALSSEGSFSIVSMIVGSITCSLLALVFAIPLGLGSAIFIYQSKIKVLRTFVDLLAGIPSVVFGLWGLTSVVPIINSINPPGASLLAGACVLAIMIAPVIILTTLSALFALPSELNSAGKALGMKSYSIITTVLIPSAWQSILAGIILALARAFGETIAILMVCGNIAQIPRSIFDPILTLTSVIGLEMGYAYGAHTQALYVAGSTLLIVVTTLIVITRTIGNNYE